MEMDLDLVQFPHSSKEHPGVLQQALLMTMRIIESLPILVAKVPPRLPIQD